MTQIRLVNHTDYRDADLLKVIRACARAARVRHPKRVMVFPFRYCGCEGEAETGSAEREGTIVEIWVGPSVHSKTMAQLGAHEFMHCRGITHEQMGCAQRECRQRVPWMRRFWLRKK